MANQPTSFRHPFHLPESVDPQVAAALRYLHNGMKDVNDAVVAMVPKLGTGAKVVASSSSPQTVVVASGGSTPGTSSVGTVNQQYGTNYAIRNSDFGALVVLGNPAPVALSLDNTLVTNPFYCVVENIGVGLVTVTPVSGTVNSAASITLPSLQPLIVFFDGINWWATTLPKFAQTIAAVTSNWLRSYDAATGLFTASQPAYSDLTGTPTVPGPSSTVPMVESGTGAVGTGTTYARADHVHPLNASLPGLPVYANNAAAVTGGLAVGALYRTGVDPDFVAVVH